MSEHTGGTVTYHRAEYRPGTDEPWLVWFTEDQADPYWFTAEQGEAMGLTVPEPPPLVVECNGHRIELSDKAARLFAETWEQYQDSSDGWDPAGRVAASIALARLLRDARQDPQPASPVIGEADPEFERLLAEEEEIERAAREGQASDDIDFDALPIGTVLTFQSDSFESTIVRQMGGWRNVADGSEDIPTDPTTWRIVYQPPVLSPRQHLEALLAGRDDADELLHGAAESWYAEASGPRPIWWSTLRGVIGDAARGGAA